MEYLLGSPIEWNGPLRGFVGRAMRFRRGFRTCTLGGPPFHKSLPFAGKDS